MLVRSQWGGGWALGDRVLAGAGHRSKHPISKAKLPSGELPPPQGDSSCPKPLVPFASALPRAVSCTGTSPGAPQHWAAPRSGAGGLVASLMQVIRDGSSALTHPSCSQQCFAVLCAQFPLEITVTRSGNQKRGSPITAHGGQEPLDPGKAAMGSAACREATKAPSAAARPSWMDTRGRQLKAAVSLALAGQEASG